MITVMVKMMLVMINDLDKISSPRSINKDSTKAIAHFIFVFPDDSSNSSSSNSLFSSW